MVNDNPYATPKTDAALPSAVRPATRMRRWLGFLIAPLVAPVLAAVLVFTLGMLFADPEDLGTPIGIILLPLVLLTVGVAISYLLALLVGMPIVLFLDRKQMLTGYTIHGAALIVVLLLTGLLTLWNVIVESYTTVADAVLGAWVTFLLLAPAMLVSTVVFWLIIRSTAARPPTLDR